MIVITAICCLLAFPVALYLIFNFIPKFLIARKLARWRSTPKDLVILHCLDKVGKGVPNASPFALKLRTFLRMANIQYQIDSYDAFGPKDKTPWITLNGEHVSDSQLIINFLEKKFEVDLNKNFAPDQLAVATLARVVLEEHFFWGAVLWAFIYEGRPTVRDNYNVRLNPVTPILTAANIRYQTWAQGLGRHSKEDLEGLMVKDLRCLSTLLGTKKFLLGDEPCIEDAAMFGFVAQVIWGILVGSLYAKLVEAEMPNVKEYAVRMKEKYWPDWNNCLAIK